MREILFRGQTRKYGEKVRMGDGKKLPGHWVYGGVLQGVGSHSIIYGGESVEEPSKKFDKWCVHTDTIGQFTGLTDKNGRKIFEGDIVKFKNELFEVKFIEKYSRFAGVKPGVVFSVFLFSNSEVVGNVHDNPELLK